MNGHKHNGIDSPLIRGLDEKIFFGEVESILISSADPLTINDICYCNGSYIAVCNSGKILKSTDGTNWTISNISTFDLKGIAYGNGVYLIVGASGTILRSTNGTSWTGISTDCSTDLNSVCYSQTLNKFFTCGKSWSDYYLRFMSSTDGLTWANNKYNGQYGTSECLKIRDINGTICAVRGSLAVYYSTNGTSWSKKSIGMYASDTLYDIAYGNGTIVGVGKYDTTPRIVVSINGITNIQKLTNVPAVTGIYGVIFLNGKFIGVCDGGKIIESENGTDWTVIDTTITNILRSVTEGNQCYVAVGENTSMCKNEFISVLDKIKILENRLNQ